MFIQQLINGLAIGSVYALMTVGYSLIYSLMSFTNFAHGVVVTISAYIGFFVLTFLTPSIPLRSLDFWSACWADWWSRCSSSC